MIVLGIETSCDETAAAVVVERETGGAMLSNVVRSQLEEHGAFNGVVPEIAARAHLEHLDGIVRRALDDAAIRWRDLDAVAATAGPGLIGGVIVGVTTAKAISLATCRPFIAVNHLEAHALTVRMLGEVAFPYLLLLVSGGHCQLLVVKHVGRYVRLGTTLDDAAGEAFDKCARLLGLGYPGGPAIEAAAKSGNSRRFELPQPMRGRQGCNFSFSGLKTAVRLVAESSVVDGPEAIADLAASFQATVAAAIADRVRQAIGIFKRDFPEGTTLVAAGGVAANRAIRTVLEREAGRAGLTLSVPPPALCTDNAAMVAWAGIERCRLGLTDTLDTAPRPRWPLDPDAVPAPFAGVKA